MCVMSDVSCVTHGVHCLIIMFGFCFYLVDSGYSGGLEGTDFTDVDFWVA